MIKIYRQIYKTMNLLEQWIDRRNRFETFKFHGLRSLLGSYEFRFCVSYDIRVRWYTERIDISLQSCKQCRNRNRRLKYFVAPVECSLCKMPWQSVMLCTIRLMHIHRNRTIGGETVFYPVLLRAIATIKNTCCRTFLPLHFWTFLRVCITAKCTTKHSTAQHSTFNYIYTDRLHTV